MQSKLLDSINSPADLRKLPIEKLPQLADEIRDLMIDVVSRTGGHLAPSLGTVELTIALHYCYNTPEDKLIWDVGHQAYTHKILTGRRDRFQSLRQFGGISGFPRTSESEFDALSVGHASTSISGALGLAIGRDILKQKHSVIAVIGDGALSGGLAFEGLNNLGSSTNGLTIILNDNEMSISKNVGALSRYLTMVITDKRYNRIKSEISNRLGKSNVGKSIRSMLRGIDYALKHIVIPGKIFEDMGLRYLGPVDGHNIPEMVEVFRSINSMSIPQLVHVITKKGKGYSFAENDATKFHGIGGFSRSTGVVTKTPSAPTYSEVFGKTLSELAKLNSKITGITAAMRDGTKMVEFSKEFPDRFFDVGIAESHAVTFAAGLALKGLTPVIVLYSTFLQRAYDQILHDIALDKLHVVFCIDRAGLVGDDGPTHHGMFDISFLRTVPGAVIMAPRNENQLRHMMYTAVTQINGPAFIRYPRGCGTGSDTTDPFKPIPIGVPEIITKGSELAIVALGDFFGQAEKVCEELRQKGLSPSLIDGRFAKPLDEEFYRDLFSKHKYIVTLENNTVAGGFGSALMELSQSFCLDHPPRFVCLGLPDSFVGHGDLPSLHRELGLDTESIVRKITQLINNTQSLPELKSHQLQNK